QTIAVREPEHTTHYSVVDAEGNAVSVTTTLNDSFGSRVTVPGLGFLLNDEMDDFTSKPGAPNLYGLIQSPNNAIGPEKRPLAHHHHRGQHPHGGGGLRHEHPGGGGHTAFPSPVATRHGIPGEGLFTGHDQAA